MPGSRRPTLTAVLSDFPPHLRELLQSDCTWDDEATAALWDRYIADRSADDEQRLVNHYMPSVAAMVSATVNGNAKGFPDPLEDYLSDGMLGLIRFIRSVKTFKYRLTAYLLRRAIVRSVWSEARARSWAGKSCTERARTIELIRADLVNETGTMPTSTQIMERLRTKLKNPTVYFSSVDDNLRSMSPRSQVTAADKASRIQRIDKQVPQPIDHALSDEVKHLAMNGLKGKDRQIFRMMLAGKGARAIAQKLGLSPTTIKERLNGVLWEARCRADLAAWLEVEPATAPLLRKDGKLAPISAAPPAPWAKAG